MSLPEYVDWAANSVLGRLCGESAKPGSIKPRGVIYEDFF